MQGKSPMSTAFGLNGAPSTVPTGEMNPQPAVSSVGQAQYDCMQYSACLGIAAEQGWAGLSCEACAVYRPIPFISTLSGPSWSKLKN